MRSSRNYPACTPRQGGTDKSSGCHIPLLALLAFILLAGCARYEAKPLDMNATFPDDPQQVLVDPTTLRFPALAAHPFDSSDGLDAIETAVLAVVNNPDLRTARAEAGVSHAQAFAAGLLPDPQFSLSKDYPTKDIDGSNQMAHSYGLNYDLNVLLTYGATVDAAKAAVHQADLGLLWLEWQTASRARLLFARVTSGESLERLFEDDVTLLEKRQEQMDRALDAGQITMDVVGLDLAALADAKGRLSDQRRILAQDRHDLTLLLGLAAGTQLRLVGVAAPPSLDEKRVEARLTDLAFRRPDLLALKWGYESQDAEYRKAIINQFPALNLGFTQAADTSNVKTLGFNFTVSLPLFNRNRGNIAVAKATRQRLFDDFKARLATARFTVSRLLEDLRLVRARLKDLDDSLPRLERISTTTRAAADTGDLSEQMFLTLYETLNAKLAERIRLEQIQIEQRLALETMLGCDPSVLAKAVGPAAAGTETKDRGDAPPQSGETHP